MRTFIVIILSGLFNCALAQIDSLKLSNYSINVGGSIGPQMAFLAALDMGAYSNIELQPLNNSLSIIGGVELRNRWFTIDIGQNAGTKGLKTHYSLVGSGYAGVGLSFISKTKKEKNSFYLTANPYIFSYKESIINEYFDNTTPRKTRGFNSGITWSNTTISEKGRKIVTQFYLPIFGGHPLDEMRYMSLRFGIGFL
jgi:hypothetical protein